MLGPAEYEREAEVQVEECKQKVVGVLKELRVFHSERMTAWREALSECACMLNKSPPRGGDQQDASITDFFSDTFQSLSEDIENITQKLSTIVTKLEAEVLCVSAEEASGVNVAPHETRDPETSARPEVGRKCLSFQDPLHSDCEQEAENESDRRHPSPNAELTAEIRLNCSDCSDVKETGGELEVKGQVDDNEEGCVSPVSQTDLLKERDKDTGRMNVKVEEETKTEWITVG
nr:PREDICTED: uncharacterized protein LOC109634931 [Paralichthys olivaceus]